MKLSFNFENTKKSKNDITLRIAIFELHFLQKNTVF